MKYGNIKTVILWNLVFITFLFFGFAFAQGIPAQEGQVYVCPLATEMEEINPKCKCRIDLILWETVTSTCGTTTYEMTLTIIEYEGRQYYAIYGFENGGAGVNLKPEAKISGKFEGIVGETLSFSGADSFDPNGDPLYFRWDFGDGSFVEGENLISVSHTYNLAGNYLLTLEVGDGLASSSATTSLTITSRPSVSFFPRRIWVAPPLVKEEKPKTKEKEEKEIAKETKFLAPPPSEISFKILIEKKELVEEKKELPEQIEEREKSSEEKEIEKPFLERETLLASLIGVLKGKIPIYFAFLFALIFITFGVIKIKNYLLLKKKL